MKRTVLLLAGLTLGVSMSQLPAVAQDSNDAPVITLMEWKNPPVTTGHGQCDEQGICEEETLIIEAEDPDSSITEVEIWFDENGDRAPFVYAHTYCVQGTEPGTPAHLEVGVTFTEPGDYVVAAVAHSHEACLGHEEGDAHPALHSEIERLPTTVRKPLRILLDKPLVEGGETRVRLRNDGGVAYKYNADYEACEMVFRDGSGRRFLVPEGTHCDLEVRPAPRVGPGETVSLFRWDLDECIKDRFGCVKSRDLPPGKYSMRGWFKPVGGGDVVRVTKRFRIQREG